MYRQILVVDDEEKITTLLTIYLEKEGFIVNSAADGNTALSMLREKEYDLLILDIMLPGVDGWEICRQIRKKSDIPVIMLTARGDEIDRVLGLEIGADDYIVKPFSPREMVARVKAVLRRTGRQKIEDTKKRLTFKELIIYPTAREVIVNEQSIALTPKEFDLLYFLARNAGQVFNREQLLERVWGYDFYGDLRTVDTHINRLRDKIGKENDVHKYIVTVWGVGYKFEAVK